MNNRIFPENVKKDVYYNSEESELEFEESIAERTKMRGQTLDEEIHKGQGLKILTPDQMRSRLLISLAQLKAGNNSEKLKNEIKQVLHYFYFSKKLTETNYKHLVSII